MKLNLIIILLISSNFVLGQLSNDDDTFVKEIININSGMPSNEVYHIVQDKNKNLWFATDNGIVKYDGRKLKVYNTNDGLPEAVVFRFYPQDDGRIYGETIDNKYFYIENDSIFPYEFNHITSKLSLGKRNSSFYIDSLQNFHFGGKNGRYFIDNVGATSGYPKNILIKILDSNIPHTQTINFEKTSNSIFTFISTTISEKNNYGIKDIKNDNTIYFYKKNYRPLNSSPKKAAKINNNSTAIMYGPSVLVLKEGIVLQEINLTTEIINVQNIDSQIWLSTLDGGTHSYNISGDTLIKSKSLLNGYSVTSVLKDHENGLWFSTREAGVFYFKNSVVSILYSSKIKSNISSFYKDKKETLIGFDNGYLIDGNRNKELADLNHQILGIYKKKPDDDFIICKGDLTICYSTKDKILTPLFGKGELVNNHSFRKIINLPNDLYLANTSANIFIYNRKSHAPIKTFSRIEINDRVLDINYINNKIIIGGTNALLIINTEDYSIENRIPLSSPTVTIKEHQGQTIIGCRNGDVFKLVNTNLIKQKFNGFKLDSRIYDIETLNNDLIIAGNNGIQKYSYNSKTQNWKRISYINLKNVIDIYVNQSELYYVTKSKIYKDLNTFTSPVIPLTKITNVTINNEETSQPSPLNLDHFERNISFHFSSISYSEKFLHYRYKLNGYSENYIFTTDNKITFSSLLPGEYCLKISSSTNGVDYSLEESFCFTIHPPFWKTTWFTILFLVFISAILLLVYFNQIKKYKSKILLKQSIDKLKSKALAAQLNPHLIFNILNSIQAIISNEEIENANIYLAKFATFMRNTLEFSKQTKIELTDEVKITNQYIELELLRFPENMKIEIFYDKISSSYYVPPLFLQPYIENAIKHGIMPVKGLKGEISIYIKEAENSLHIEIEDNGIGFKSEFQEGDGMRISRERLQLLNNNNKLNINRLNNKTIVSLQIHN